MFSLVTVCVRLAFYELFQADVTRCCCSSTHPNPLFSFITFGYQRNSFKCNNFFHDSRVRYVGVGKNNEQETRFRFILDVFSGALCRGTCTWETFSTGKLFIWGNSRCFFCFTSIGIKEDSKLFFFSFTCMMISMGPLNV